MIIIILSEEIEIELNYPFLRQLCSRTNHGDFIAGGRFDYFAEFDEIAVLNSLDPLEHPNQLVVVAVPRILNIFTAHNISLHNKDVADILHLSSKLNLRKVAFVSRREKR